VITKSRRNAAGLDCHPKTIYTARPGEVLRKLRHGWWSGTSVRQVQGTVLQRQDASRPCRNANLRASGSIFGFSRLLASSCLVPPTPRGEARSWWVWWNRRYSYLPLSTLELGVFVMVNRSDGFGSSLDVNFRSRPSPWSLGMASRDVSQGWQDRHQFRSSALSITKQGHDPISATVLITDGITSSNVAISDVETCRTNFAKASGHH